MFNSPTTDKKNTRLILAFAIPTGILLAAVNGQREIQLHASDKISSLAYIVKCCDTLIECPLRLISVINFD